MQRSFPTLRVNLNPGKWKAARRLLPALMCAINNHSWVRSHVLLPMMVEVAILPNAEMQRLNRQTRQKRTIPNVLSFRYNSHDPENAIIVLGEVLISYPHVKIDAKRFGRDSETHGKYLITHGILHLLGFDHQNAKAAQRMEKIEDQIITAMHS
ncbi:MAG: rRNA maturation RNase YbeY [Candidatus Kerfeldbacteria bacterium]|nr:rRNA maturation RNase YbeY [Candidatus Kerfeldbacteria bacterium]